MFKVDARVASAQAVKPALREALAVSPRKVTKLAAKPAVLPVSAKKTGTDDE